MLSKPERWSGGPRGLGLACLAGLGFGGFFIGLGEINQAAVFCPLAAGRLAAIAVLVLVGVASKRPVGIRRIPIGLILLAGVLDIGGNLCFLLSTQNGRLDVTAVLGSLYPAVTALIAWWAIKERMTRLQVVGIGAAVLAIALITA